MSSFKEKRRREPPPEENLTYYNYNKNNRCPCKSSDFTG
jgi:hypothetical protein